MTKIPNIARSTSYLTLALIIQKVISFSYFIILTRALGLEVMGQYYTAISFTTILGIFIDLGLANVLTREVAKSPEGASRWLGNVIGIKIPLAVATFLVALLMAQLLGYEPLVWLLILISAFSMVLDSFTATFFATLRGLHTLKYESLASIIFQALVFVFGGVALYFNQGVLVVIFALVLASTFNFIFSFRALRRELKTPWYPVFNRESWRKIWLLSWPFGMFAIAQRLYLYLDSVLLSNLADFHEVGVYQIAFKIINALQFLPLAFVASLYPAMSAYWLNSRNQLAVSLERALSYLTIISLPIIAGVFALDQAILDIFKAGPEALWPLRVSILALFFIFVNYPIGSLLNACDRQKKNLLFISTVAFSSFVLNLFLIPRWGALGASITVLLTNGLMFILGIFEVNKIIKYNFKKNLIVVIKSLLAALVMALIVYLGKNYLSLPGAVILGGFTYFFSLYLLGGFSRADILSVKQSFKR